MLTRERQRFSLPIASGHPALHDPTLPLPLQLSHFSYNFPDERIDPKLPGTAWYRANRRAKKLVKEAGVWEEMTHLRSISAGGKVELDEKKGKRIDAVKGYVGKSGDFCGLRFRRDGGCESNVFGHRSAYELIFELMEGEPFYVGIFSSSRLAPQPDPILPSLQAL